MKLKTEQLNNVHYTLGNLGADTTDKSFSKCLCHFGIKNHPKWTDPGVSCSLQHFVSLQRLALSNQGPLLTPVLTGSPVTVSGCDTAAASSASAQGLSERCPYVRPNYFLSWPLEQGHTCYATVPSTQSDPSQRELISFLHKPLSWSHRLFRQSATPSRWDNDSPIAVVKTLISIPLRSFKLSANIHQLQIGVKLKRRPAGERPRQAGPSSAATADVDEAF